MGGVLAGKVILITKATEFVGEAVVGSCLAEGATVLVASASIAALAWFIATSNEPVRTANAAISACKLASSLAAPTSATMRAASIIDIAAEARCCERSPIRASSS